MLTFVLNATHFAHSLLSHHANSGQKGSEWVLFFFLSPALLYIVYYLWSEKKDLEWVRIIYSSELPFRRSYLSEAYVRLAALFIRADTVETRQKVQYIRAHFQKYFPSEIDELSEQLTRAYKVSLDLKGIGQWMKAKMSYDQRVQVLYFLMGLTFVDGSMNGAESALIRQMVEVLEITPKDYQSILGMYQQRHQRTEDPGKYNNQSAIKLCCEILGVSEHAAMEEIKKAYRQMAKKHHPDRFATEGSEQQRLAQERFQEIQRAYEILEKLR
jgi:DnaJ like chaperone protein